MKQFILCPHLRRGPVTQGRGNHALVHDEVEIETAIVALEREPEGGLVVTAEAFVVSRRAPLILAAARNNVPAVYLLPEAARDGGLLSYGPDLVDNFRRVATYVGSHPARREARRSPGAVSDQVRAGGNLKTAITVDDVFDLKANIYSPLGE
jgi:putative ABC transport system substrate-binding protein